MNDEDKVAEMIDGLAYWAKYGDGADRQGYFDDEAI
jgi:hypothetical protein